MRDAIDSSQARRGSAGSCAQRAAVVADNAPPHASHEPRCSETSRVVSAGSSPSR